MDVATPLTLQLLAGLVVIGAQAVLFAFFQGKMKGNVEALDRRIGDLNDSVKRIEEFRSQTITSGADVEARLAQVERSSAALDAVRSDFIAHRATAQEQHRQNQDALQRMNRGIDTISAQFAALSRSAAQLATREALGVDHHSGG